MVETAAHLVENVIPSIPMRQWVISFPKRIRCYLQTNVILQDVLRIVVDEVRKTLISCCPKVFNAQIGAISFIQRFGNTLNLHPHFHLVFTDGIFETENETLNFYPAVFTPEDMANTQENRRRRTLGLFASEAGLNNQKSRKC
jgi:hypothetical protein